MKITICSSLSFVEDVIKVRDKLVQCGHDVLLPESMNECIVLGVKDAKAYSKEKQDQSVQNITDKMRLHFEKIKDSDAILVFNHFKKEVENYIGPSSFLEMGIALHYGKKIFLLNPIPDMGLRDEVHAMQPVILNGDLSLIK